ncbi:hypothetical protein [Porphyrobacter sp. GA68]|uniref:hypothetical protein n=1 Tax=Porphyrobacter sp. GA68 TaxID=2883480 RepID=UPI001D18189D|nr:hypothetical protein [Porphyrobacter sp. GA68]
MSDPDKSQSADGQDWRGFREVDRAIAENRLTAYTWKKTWADPLGRAIMLLVFALLAGFLIFVLLYDFIL